ncbi:Fur family transcriptional regulator [Luteolibacter yonseiensis]
MITNDFVQQARHIWRRRGRRLTPVRERLCAVIADQKCAFDAEKLWSEVRKHGLDISISGVYRALADLLDAGFLTEIHGAGGLRSFVISAGSANIYIVCKKCRKIVSIYDHCLDALAGKAGDLGFRTDGVSLQIQTECRSCPVEITGMAKESSWNGVV